MKPKKEVYIMPKSKLDLLTKSKLKEYIQQSSSFEELCCLIGYKQINPDLQDKICALCNKYEIDSSIVYVRELKTHKKCSICNCVKSVKEFYERRTVCKECVRALEREKYHQRMNTLNDYKKTLSCSKCGDSRFYLLEFHHIDPSKKDYSISDNPNAKLETILTEIEKCIPLCANCHREFHYLNREQGIELSQYLES